MKTCKPRLKGHNEVATNYVERILVTVHNLLSVTFVHCDLSV